MLYYRAWQVYDQVPLLLQPLYHAASHTWKEREARADLPPSSAGWERPRPFGPQDQHGLYGYEKMDTVLSQLHNPMTTRESPHIVIPSRIYIPGAITVWGHVVFHEDGQVRAEAAIIEELYVLICPEATCERCIDWMERATQISRHYQVPLIAGRVSIVSHRPLQLAEVSQQR